ncbi:LRR amino-terminal domain protein [Medicago truncatula]|uniref:LRR amino-terminal domain protein n=2 Tax=Medicago truncatula TaxID=3880 RepID=A0A072UVD0_MEDTR|nr:LRR amino-terminal domain protein [Medicago truncatula]
MVRCNEKDLEILLTFKQGINNSLSLFSRWSAEKDCCVWEGVHCDNITGRVTEINRNTYFFEYESVNVLEGEMNLCIFELEFLSYLDLSHNKFNVIRIPSIQHNITHSSNLVKLDLSFNFLHMYNLDWLSPLSSLKYLNLGGIDLHKEKTFSENQEKINQGSRLL